MNESDDGVIDGVADFDDDGLSTLLERELGTDPLAQDSDGDGLPDRYELVVTETDPVSTDTTGNGTTDGAADPDGDSLANVEEFDAGTNPLSADTDADNSSDAVELDVGTDPLDPDTDGDGLLDGVEPFAPYETDPLDPDTDSDGVLDGNETFTSTTSDERVGASVTTSGNGTAVTDVTIESGNESAFVSESVESSSVSEQVVLDGSGVENATLSLATGNASDLSNVSVYRYNRTAQTYEQVSSDVDSTNETVSAAVSTPGLYVAMDVQSWESGFDAPLPKNYSETGDFANSSNVVLYAEHLEGGISPSEAVDAQVGVHNEWEAPMARGANVTGGPEKEHSNVHLGELHWGSDPRDSLDTSASAASLDFEVDWLYDENILSSEGPISHDPRNIRNPDTNATLIEDVKQNYALYGINVTFHRDDQVNSSDLHTVYKGQVGGTPTFISPDSMNAQELNAVRERYHDNRSRVHLFFSNNYRNDLPMFLPHDAGIPNGVWGLTGHTGSPTQVGALEKTGRVPYGVVIMNETLSTYKRSRITTLHEVGHVFGAGYLDDKAAQVGECYSGTKCVFNTLGDDDTPERVGTFSSPSWSIMSQGTRPQRTNYGNYVFSIEELLTVDTKEVPSRDD